ncbi:MAG: hypothetical protein QXQ46_05000 [Thermoplasmatales archaeon]
MSSDVKPILPSAFLEAGTGPRPVRYGGAPAYPKPASLEIGLSPSSLTFLPEARIISAAPALKGEEFPAIITPSALKTGEVRLIAPGRYFPLYSDPCQ